MGLINFIAAMVALSRNKGRQRGVDKSERDIHGEIMFNIEHGLICHICEAELPLIHGGYSGEPTLCENCEKEKNK